MNRRSFLASSVSLAAAVPAVGAAQSVPGGTHLVERRSDFDAAAFAQAVDRPGTVIRQLWEAVAFHPAVFNNVKNSLNGLQFGFGHDPDQIAVVFAPHGPSAAFTYSDDIWRKYRLGDAFKLKDAQGNTITSNVFLRSARPPDSSTDPDDPDSIYQDTSIEALQKRGVVFLTCHTAVEEQARTLVRGGFAPGMSAPDVADDILTHLIDGAHVVPSMVATIAVLQAVHHYTYITVAFE